MQRYNWNNTFNARDLGYTPTANKNSVKPQRFIRSDAPLIVNDGVKEFLIRHNIRTVIDLRNEKIANMSPNAFVSDCRFTCYNYPLSINAKAPNSENDVISLVETQNLNGFYFPIDPKHLIFIARGEGNINRIDYRMANEELVKKFNRIIASYKINTIIANTKDSQSFM